MVYSYKSNILVCKTIVQGDDALMAKFWDFLILSEFPLKVQAICMVTYYTTTTTTTLPLPLLLQLTLLLQLPLSPEELKT